MNMLVDIPTLAGHFKTNLKRFPIPIGFNILLCAVLIFKIWDEAFEENKLVNISIYYLSVGFLLSLCLKLWAEEVQKKTIVMYVTIVLHAILLLDSIYLYTITSISWLEVSWSRASAIVALVANRLRLQYFPRVEV